MLSNASIFTQYPAITFVHNIYWHNKEDYLFHFHFFISTLSTQKGFLYIDISTNFKMINLE